MLNAETGETLADFFNRAFAFADAHDVEKVVLDIRNNGGGNNTLTQPIIQNIVMRPSLNQRGKLFVIMGVARRPPLKTSPIASSAIRTPFL